MVADFAWQTNQKEKTKTHPNTKFIPIFYEMGCKTCFVFSVSKIESLTKSGVGGGGGRPFFLGFDSLANQRVHPLVLFYGIQFIDIYLYGIH